MLDIVPAHYLYSHVTREFVESYFHWFLFIRPAPFPEDVIAINEGDITAGKKIDCPLNVLWGDNAAMGRQYDVLSIWQLEATRAEGKAMPGGHSFQVDSPEATAIELRRFLPTV